MCNLENAFYPLNLQAEIGTRPQQQLSIAISLTTSTMQAHIARKDCIFLNAKFQ